MRWLGIMVACALLVWACSASNAGSELGDGASSTSSGSGAGASGSTSSADIGGFFGQGGATTTSTGIGGACESVSEEAKPKLQDADIIFAIDTSGSMGEENHFVRTEMNAFSQQIVASGIDVRVIMLAEAMLFPCFGIICPPGICIDPPLGSGLCPADTKLPNYLHVPGSDVYSTDALSIIIDMYPSYAQQLRMGATKSLVIITDDNAASPYIADATTFLSQFVALDPGLLTGTVAHGIYCFDGNSPCVTKGTVYEDLINQTGGIHGDLAKQNFKAVFDKLAEQVILNAGKLPCEYLLPPPPMGESFDPNKVNVEFTSGDNNTQTIFKVDDESKCHPQNGGWYYDDNNNPTSIKLCPKSCDLVSNDPMGKIDILLGCETLLPPPD